MYRIVMLPIMSSETSVIKRERTRIIKIAPILNPCLELSFEAAHASSSTSGEASPAVSAISSIFYDLIDRGNEGGY